MPRTKEFDYDRALDDATRLFWDKGYEATSIQDLVNATGVNRASLYQSFGGKRELFQKALERFQLADEQSFACLTTGSAPGLEKIRRVFQQVACQVVDDAKGCLVINSIAELSTQDKDIHGMGKQVRERIENFFAACLKEARRRKELPPGKDIRALARFLTNAFFGLRMMAKMQPNRELVDDIVSSTLAALK
jgi:TetR/AcrR family transcriptional regulator, transcriptional repressor for nem operon